MRPRPSAGERARGAAAGEGRTMFRDAEQVLIGLDLNATRAAALAGHADQPWSNLALVVDVDDHALTWGAVAAEEGWARLVDFRAAPQLGLRAWKDRLLDAIADRCVRQSRRDPRDSAVA